MDLALTTGVHLRMISMLQVMNILVDLELQKKLEKPLLKMLNKLPKMMTLLNQNQLMKDLKKLHLKSTKSNWPNQEPNLNSISEKLTLTKKDLVHN